MVKTFLLLGKMDTIVHMSGSFILIFHKKGRLMISKGCVDNAVVERVVSFSPLVVSTIILPSSYSYSTSYDPRSCLLFPKVHTNSDTIIFQSSKSHWLLGQTRRLGRKAHFPLSRFSRLPLSFPVECAQSIDLVKMHVRDNFERSASQFSPTPKEQDDRSGTLYQFYRE